jgi:hypothetical protein
MGTGQVTCQECEGSGNYNVPIDVATFPKRLKCYDKLMNLKEDAIRAVEQTNELCRLKPEREARYREQLQSLLKQIENTAQDMIDEEFDL